MKNIVVVLILSLPMSVLAEKSISCDDLSEASITITQILEVLDKMESIDEGSEIDSNLREMIDDLNIIAQVEKQKELEKFAEKMDEGWSDMDKKKLVNGLSNAKKSLDNLIQADCN